MTRSPARSTAPPINDASMLTLRSTSRPRRLDSAATSADWASSLTGMGGAHNILCEGLPPYVVFVDAGSTGCRAHTFKVVPGELPAFALRTMGKKVKGNTPLASLAGKTDEQITEALLPMLLKALEKVPQQHRGDTPLYVWATAGMRVLKDHQQDHLWAVRNDPFRVWNPTGS